MFINIGRGSRGIGMHGPLDRVDKAARPPQPPSHSPCTVTQLTRAGQQTTRHHKPDQARDFRGHIQTNSHNTVETLLYVTFRFLDDLKLELEYMK